MSFFSQHSPSQTRSSDHVKPSGELRPLLDELRASSYRQALLRARSHGSFHVAGYMDYDPKTAAKNAYLMAMKEHTKRDKTWFDK